MATDITEVKILHTQKSPSETTKIPAEMRSSVLVGDLQRYAYWIGPRSNWVMGATGFLGWRLSRAVQKKLGRPVGALSWPVGLGLLCLNSRASPFKSVEMSILNQALDGFERQSAIHVDWCGVLYGALGVYEGLSHAQGVERVDRLVLPLMNRPGAADGEISYAANRDEILIDTIGMICPMLARLGRLTGNDRYREMALLQLERFLDLGIDEETGWPWHGYRRGSGERLGLPGWGRGLGWLVLGMVDTILELSEKNDCSKWFEITNRWIERMYEFQMADGNWPWLLTERNARYDTSVTAMLGYAACRFYGHNFGRNDTARLMYERAFAAIDEMTDPLGRVQSASGEALGWGDYSQQFGNNLWVQGPAVALQVLKDELNSRSEGG